MKIRFHGQKRGKERECFHCGDVIEKDEWRYQDKKENQYYCRDCAELIAMGVEYALEKYKIKSS